MNSLNLIVKGFLIGLGKIIPGVSGAVLAVIFGLYDKALDAVTHFFDNKKKNFLFLLKTGFGVVLAIVFGSKIVIYFLNNYRFLTMLFFIGLMFGGVPSLLKKVDKKVSNYILFVSGVIFMFALSLINIKNNVVISGDNIFDIFLLFVGGLVDAFSSIVPGISGTAMLMLMGLYEIIIECLGNLTNINAVIENLYILIPFSIGMLIGFIAFAKLMSFLFKKYSSKTYSFITGIVLSTFIILLVEVFQGKFNYFELIFGIVLAICGYFIAKKLDK